LLLTAIDSLLAEVLAGSAALHELIGNSENLGGALTSLMRLFLGQEPLDAGERAGFIALTQHFAADDLPEARTAVASRIMAEFKSPKRLVPNALDEEFKTLREYMAGAATPDEKVERLLFVEENIIGAENKRQLATFVQPILTAASFETHFTAAKTPVLQRIQRLAQLQARVRRSGFQENQRQEMADTIDKLACAI